MRLKLLGTQSVLAKMKTYKAIETTVDKLTSARNQMYKTRRFLHTPESVERELADLKSKVQLGTKLRDKLYGGDYVLINFDSFNDVILKYMSILPRPKAKDSTESAKRAVPRENQKTEKSSDPNWDNQSWDQGYSEEPGMRVGDTR